MGVKHTTWSLCSLTQYPTIRPDGVADGCSCPAPNMVEFREFCEDAEELETRRMPSTPNRITTASAGTAIHAYTIFLLRRGCWLSRQRFYSHRGLPLYALEFYAAATTNHEGSMTEQVQDRQVASWLMGMPVCYSGDARTLTDDNIRHYRRRFDAIRRLENTYGIYRRFQFSGVPEPTDTDWHWWGKLNVDGCGVIVVMRGSEGEPRRAVNIPWVRDGKQYRVSGVFSGKQYGLFSGRQLKNTGLMVALPAYGQDLLELAPGGEAAR